MGLFFFFLNQILTSPQLPTSRMFFLKICSGQRTFLKRTSETLHFYLHLWRRSPCSPLQKVTRGFFLSNKPTVSSVFLSNIRFAAKNDMIIQTWESLESTPSRKKFIPQQRLTEENVKIFVFKYVQVGFLLCQSWVDWQLIKILNAAKVLVTLRLS